MVMKARQYDVITFDCYGTLVDWEGGITRAFAEAASGAGLACDAQAVLAAHADIEPRVQAAGYRSYREVLRETAKRIAERLGWPISDEQATFLANSLPTWKPFEDTNPALRRLADAGYELGILSNVDDDLLAGTLRRLSVRFDMLVTAQQLRSYKPAHTHFVEARRRIGERRWLHAAQSHFHDVVPARQLGIPVAWVNRKAETAAEDAPPDREVQTMTDLADWLT
jgi:2-haloacid dehalogenase/putative hydrolase of the HAD superfamily